MNFDSKNLQNYSVKILHPDGNSIIGTGFFFHPEGYVLTCHHVIDTFYSEQEKVHSEGNIQIVCGTDSRKNETIFLSDLSSKNLDIAVLKIKDDSIPPKKFPYLPLEIHNARWKTTLEKITSFGYPSGQFSELGIQATGEISGSAKHNNTLVYQIGGFSISEINQGFSGGPVICLRTGKVIGLVHAIYPGGANLAYFVPTSDIVVHWEKSWIQIIEFHDVFKRIQKEIQRESYIFLQEKLKNSLFIPLNLQHGEVPEKKKKTVKKFDDDQERENKKNIHHRTWHNFSVNDLLPPKGSYLLSANVGFGKTTFLYWLSSEINKNFDNLGIFIESSIFADWKPESWGDLKQKIFNRLTLHFQNNSEFYVNDEDIKDCLDFFFHNNKVVFLYDGLDQIPGQSLDYSQIVKSMLRIAGQNKIIISSRPSALVRFDEDSNFTFLRLMQFSKDDEKKYFGEYFVTVSSVRALAPELKSIPMLAFMVKTLAIKGNINEIKNRADLYERFIDHILTQQNPCTLDGQSLKVREELEKISFESLHSSSPSIQIIPANATYINKDTISSVLKFGLVNLILEDSKQFLFFTHTSFQEYLAAKFLANSNNRCEYIRQITSEREVFQWKEIIRFLAGLLGNEIISEVLSHKVSSLRSKYSRTRTGEFIFTGIESVSNFFYKPLIPRSNLFIAAEILPEVKNLDIKLHQKIYSELHNVRNANKNNNFYDDSDFIGALIFLSRGQGIPNGEIKKIVVDIINCVTIFEDKKKVAKNEGFEEYSELINDNDPIFLQQLSTILSIHQDSIRSVQLEVFKEEMIKK